MTEEILYLIKYQFNGGATSAQKQEWTTLVSNEKTRLTILQQVMKTPARKLHFPLYNVTVYGYEYELMTYKMSHDVIEPLCKLIPDSYYEFRDPNEKIYTCLYDATAVVPKAEFVEVKVKKLKLI